MPEKLRKILADAYKLFARTLNKLGAGRIPFFQDMSRFCYSLLAADCVEIEGFKIYVDKKDSLRLSVHGKYEPFELSTIQSETKEGDAIVDVGANIGHHTLFLSRQVGPKGHVYAFEPDKDNYSLLEKNIKINNISNVTAINKAVSDKTGKLKLFLSDINKGDHRIFESQEVRDFTEIDTVSLDDYFDGKDIKVDFIKMDVQGAEYLVLSGMTGLLEKNKKLGLIIEYTPEGLNQCGKNHHILLPEFLEKHGFTLYEVTEEEKQLKKISKSELLEKFSLDRNVYVNILAKRE